MKHTLYFVFVSGTVCFHCGSTTLFLLVRILPDAHRRNRHSYYSSCCLLHTI